MIKSFKAKLDNAPAFELAHEIAKSSNILNDLYIDKTPEGIVRYENIQELLNGISEFSESEKSSLSDYLIDVALLTNADNEKIEDFNKITLMTIHSAKGLEFPFVYIVGIEENLFPSLLSLSSRAELEEERRLFYVALTRAKKKATLSYAISRYKWGNFITCEPSRFIEEIDKKYLDLSHIGVHQKNVNHSKTWVKKKLPERNINLNNSNTRSLKKISDITPVSNASAANNKIKVGAEVKHDRFGKGKVIELSGQSPNIKATVYFPSSGQKQLLLKFAKLQILN